MDLSKSILRQIIAGHPVGEAWPYHGGSDGDVETYLEACVEDINTSERIIAGAHFNHYGSGYASFVDVFCYRTDNSSTIEYGTVTEYRGITLYLCRLAPIAVYGKNTRTIGPRVSSASFLSAENVGTVPDHSWDGIIQDIQAKLINRGLSILDQLTARQPLSFDASISTNLSDPPYRVFDALFYWED
jgi:hypothetical protein